MTVPITDPGFKEGLLRREEHDNRIVRLVMTQPKRFNSLSTAMIAALQTELDRIVEEDTARALIIAAEGRGFCGGHDLKEMTAHREDADGGKAYYESLFAACTKMMLSIMRLPIVVIAEVQGVATAAGCQLVSTCDLAVASTDARFGVNGVDSGLFCSTPMVALSRNMPRKTVMEMLTLGELIDAERALSQGLVNDVVPPDALTDRALAMASRAARKSRRVVALGKRAFYRQIELPIENAYDHMQRVIVDNLMMPEAKEGISAFIEKREPDWSED